MARDRRHPSSATDSLSKESGSLANWLADDDCREMADAPCRNCGRWPWVCGCADVAVELDWLDAGYMIELVRGVC
jgi:hypothetical protein